MKETAKARTWVSETLSLSKDKSDASRHFSKTGDPGDKKLAKRCSAQSIQLRRLAESALKQIACIEACVVEAQRICDA